MKICPKCRVQYDDDLYFCLDDGSTLKELRLFNPEDTFSVTDNATLEYRSPQTGNQNKQTNQTPFVQPARRSNKLLILGGTAGLVLLLFGVLLGGLLYFRSYRPDRSVHEPNRPIVPFRTPTPSAPPLENVKVEILEKVESNSGQQFLKCKLTNVGQSIISPFSVTLMFFKDDVKIKENSAFARLSYLKPQQSVPVWIGLYGTDKYTSVKVKEPVSMSAARKSEQQLFPDLAITETEMKVVYSTSYKVSGIVENQNYEISAAKLDVIFYNEKSEIIGITNARVNVKKGEKAAFEAQISDRDLFGKPKTFEIVAIAE